MNRRAPWTEILRASLSESCSRLAATGHLDLAGLVGSARLLVPLLLSDQPALFVLACEKDVETAASDLQLLVREAGLPGAVLSFPAPGPPPFRGLPRHTDASLRRAAALHAVARGARALVASPAGLLRPTLPRHLFETRVLILRAGEEMTPEILLEALDEGGYRREDPVTAPGQTARRGGIVDVFPPDREAPVRLEFFGDTVESLRSFDPETQRTTGTIEALEAVPLQDLFAPRSVLQRLRDILPARFPDRPELAGLLEKLDRGLAPDEITELLPLVPGATVPVWAHLQDWAVVTLEPEAVVGEAEALLTRAREERERHPESLPLTPEDVLVSPEALRQRLTTPPSLRLRELDPEARGVRFGARLSQRYAGDIRRLVSDLGTRSGPAVLYLGNPGRAERVKDMLREDGLALGEEAGLEVRVGALSRGFELADPALLVLADGDVFPEEVHLHPRGRRGGLKSFLSDFRDLRPATWWSTRTTALAATWAWRR